MTLGVTEMTVAWLPSLIVLTVLATATSVSSAQQRARTPASGVCADLRPLLTRAPTQRLYSLILYGETSTGVAKFVDIDIDQDGKPDYMELSCPGSTTMPADPCLLEVTPAAGSRYTVEGMPLYLLQHDKAIYAVAGDFSEWPNTRHIQVLLLAATGPRLQCAFIRPAK